MAKQFKNTAAQGELYFERVEKLPDGVKEIKAENGRLVIGHSETGHHHYVEKAQARFYGTDDPNICYLTIDGKYADLIHDKTGPDVHETVKIPNGTFRVRKQQEYMFDSWRRVQD